MGRALPGLERYLARLPLGLDSYPEAGVKGSIVRSVLGHPAMQTLADTTEIPAVVRRIIAEPPLASGWVNEVHFNALSCALVDIAFDRADGLERYEDWGVELSRGLFSAPLYRALFTVMNPSHLLTAVSMRWGAFHRGSVLTHASHPERDVIDLRLACPAHLHPPPILHATTGGFRAAIEATGGVATSVRWSADTPTTVRWLFRWKPKR